MNIAGMYRVLQRLSSRVVRPLSTDVLELGFWSYMANIAYHDLKDVPASQNKEDPWWKKVNLGHPKVKRGLAGFSVFFGCVMFGSACTFTLRSVRYLILRKGGKIISLVTYTPFGPNRIMDVPLRYVSAITSRTNARVHLPIKVHGKYLYYMLDMKGEFRNKALFDATAGMYRKF
ncbi:transmembrane protein 223 isoform X2 [Cimex lectularius]|uniref:Transmembrane protein 223 n=1 Tax=Cimex lectularius TaxID=79782 RepID=A0A8I6RUT7_CIMLE|nr:transmembrane protein 223 isoform X2 [Cimex lectularius]